MVGLGCKYNQDGDARTAVNQGVRHDSWQPQSLALWHNELESAHVEMQNSITKAYVLRKMNCIAVGAPCWAFCGYLMNIGQRDIYLNHLYELLADSSIDVPDRAQKVEICITG